MHVFSIHYLRKCSTPCLIASASCLKRNKRAFTKRTLPPELLLVCKSRWSISNVLFFSPNSGQRSRCSLSTELEPQSVASAVVEQRHQWGRGAMDIMHTQAACSISHPCIFALHSELTMLHQVVKIEDSPTKFAAIFNPQYGLKMSGWIEDYLTVFPDGIFKLQSCTWRNWEDWRLLEEIYDGINLQTSILWFRK